MMAESQEWNTPLFDCFDDCGICFCGWCFSSCLFGKNASKLDGKNGCVMCCIHYSLSWSSLGWIAQYFQRQKLRQRYGLKEDDKCSDLPAVFCCTPCALCQEAREMKIRMYAEATRVYQAQPTSAIGLAQLPTYAQYSYENGKDNSTDFDRV